MAGGPLIGPAPCPQYQVPPINPDGTWNVAWYRFLSGLSGVTPGSSPVFPPTSPAVSFTGADVSRETVDEAIQAHLPSPSIPSPDQIGAIQQALPSPALPSVDQEARDLANAAFSRVPYPPATASPQIIVCTQATFPALTGLSPTFVYVSDYSHMIFWDGAAATFADGGSAYIAAFEVDPGQGWHLCDGSPGVAYLKADGSTATVTLPDLTSSGAAAAFLELGGTNSGPTAATAPTFTGTPATPTGTVSTPAFTGTPVTPTGNVGSIFSGTPETFSTTAVTPVGAVNAFTGPNPYTPAGLVSSAFLGDSLTPAGSVSTPTFTGNSATPAGTISATAEPRKLVRRPYFRQ